MEYKKNIMHNGLKNYYKFIKETIFFKALIPRLNISLYSLNKSSTPDHEMINDIKMVDHGLREKNLPPVMASILHHLRKNKNN